MTPTTSIMKAFLAAAFLFAGILFASNHLMKGCSEEKNPKASSPAIVVSEWSGKYAGASVAAELKEYPVSAPDKDRPNHLGNATLTIKYRGAEFTRSGTIERFGADTARHFMAVRHLGFATTPSFVCFADFTGKGSDGPMVIRFDDGKLADANLPSGFEMLDGLTLLPKAAN